MIARFTPIVAVVLALAPACSKGTPPPVRQCESGAECPSGVCIDGACIGFDAAVPEERRETCVIECGLSCCRSGQRCVADTCVVELGACESHDDCAGDSYCDDTGFCTPYGVPADHASDDTCRRDIDIGTFEPEVQCHWDATSLGSGFPHMNRSYVTPLVADFDFDDDPDVRAPSIVFSSFETPQGGAILRLIDGRTCAEQVTLGSPEDLLAYGSQLAIADLDAAPGTRPEILALGLDRPMGSASLVAFAYDPVSKSFERRWVGRNCDEPGQPRHFMSGWADATGPVVHDLDDDGIPEVVVSRYVYDAEGCLLNADEPAERHLRSPVPSSVVVDVDSDGRPELVSYEGVFGWDEAARRWSLEPYWNPPPEQVPDVTLPGYVAVADFGAYACPDPDLACPEIVVVGAAPDATQYDTGYVRVMTIDGRLIFGPVPVPAEDGERAGRGGPPTVGDFDGDGHREIGVAGASRYSVIDLDCDIDDDTGLGCERPPGLPRGVLWSRRSQDESSNVTGSSVFDFDADGRAEVVYADECYARIYRGTDGEVLFSYPAPSGTGVEYPIIADVDGDYNSEIVVAMSGEVWFGCPDSDPLLPGGSVPFEDRTGIVVLRDASDGWAASRSIWNQHAYAVTHVGEDARVPRTSAWSPNHTVPELNNFRMNSQGPLVDTGLADLTVVLSRVEDLCSVRGGDIELSARVCNRGTNPVSDGARVVFYEGDPDLPTTAIACETRLPRFLEVGQCAEVSCGWSVPEEADDIASRVTVVVDPDEEVAECRDANNRGVQPVLVCDLI